MESIADLKAPHGLTVAGVPIGGLDSQQAAERLLQAYAYPVEVHYGDAIIQIKPSTASFELDLETMLAAADLTRTGGDFWSGFWEYLWNRDPAAEAVPLRATIAEDRLRNYLQAEIAPRYDHPAAPAQPVPGTTSFTPGEPGQTLDVDRAVPLIEDALKQVSMSNQPSR